MTAVEAREHIAALEAERAAAIAADLIGIDAYRYDLDAEIEIWRRYFVTAAVTEIATLRAELDGHRGRHEIAICAAIATGPTQLDPRHTNDWR